MYLTSHIILILHPVFGSSIKLRALAFSVLPALNVGCVWQRLGQIRRYLVPGPMCCNVSDVEGAEACKPYRLTVDNAVTDDICECGQEGVCILDVDVHLFRNPAG